MTVKKELVQFSLANNTDCNFNIPLFKQNVYSINATKKYSWDITAANISCGTGSLVINSVNTSITYEPNLSGLISALNALGYGFFCTETISGQTYLYVTDDTNVYGALVLCTTATTTTTSTTTAAPTTTTTTSTTTAAPSPTTTTTTSTTTAAPSPTTTTTTSTTTAAPAPTTTTTTSTTTAAPSPTTTTTTSTTTAAPETTTTTTTTSTTTAAPLAVQSFSATMEQFNVTECGVGASITLNGNVSQNTTFDFQYQLSTTGATLYFMSITVLAGTNNATEPPAGGSEANCSATVVNACINTVTGDSVSIVGFSC